MPALNAVNGWFPLGNWPPNELVDARLQLHWAAQLVSAVGTTLLPPASDDSHTNLEWLASAGLLAGHLTSDVPRCRAALRPTDLMLYLLDERGTAVAERRLVNRTFSQGMAWLAHEIAGFTKRPLPRPLQRRALQLPYHGVADGAPFAMRDTAPFDELRRWYANADETLRALAARTPDSSPVRCWPHHFDIATLMTITNAGAQPTFTIGIGLSPGDESYAEPYWYVTPWPYPPVPQLPPLHGGGEWHQTGWLGATLPAAKLVEDGSARGQVERVHAFLSSALQACRTLLESQDGGAVMVAPAPRSG